jgi:hypothetical protein
MDGYKARVAVVSKDLSATERIKFKDTSDAVGIDLALKDLESLTVTIDYYGVLDIHNEKAEDNKDYKNYVFVTTDGEKYVTGSESLWTSFTDIADELADEGMDEFPPIKFYKKETKNYKGKYFLTCSLA